MEARFPEASVDQKVFREMVAYGLNLKVGFRGRKTLLVCKRKTFVSKPNMTQAQRRERTKYACRSEWIGDQLACSGYYGVIGTPEGSFTMVLEGLEQQAKTFAFAF